MHAALRCRLCLACWEDPVLLRCGVLQLDGVQFVKRGSIGGGFWYHANLRARGELAERLKALAC